MSARWRRYVVARCEDGTWDVVDRETSCTVRQQLRTRQDARDEAFVRESEAVVARWRR